MGLSQQVTELQLTSFALDSKGNFLFRMTAVAHTILASQITIIQACLLTCPAIISVPSSLLPTLTRSTSLLALTSILALRGHRIPQQSAPCGLERTTGRGGEKIGSLAELGKMSSCIGKGIRLYLIQFKRKGIL